MKTPYKNPDLEALTGRHLLPLWDERMVFAFTLAKDRRGTQSLNEFFNVEPFAARQRRLGNLGPDDAMLLLKECLRDNQAYFILLGSNPFLVRFPYAWYGPKKGDEIDNLSTGEVYTVAEVYDPDSNDVLLGGKRRPRPTDRLRFRVENEVLSTHAHPRIFAKGQKFTEEGSVGDKPAAWNDTITYLVTRSEPGTVDNAPPFSGARQMKPQVRETFEDPLDPILLVETQGWLFDNLVQFDCWAKTNAGAVKLLKWFEDFIFRHTWIFELFGVSKVLYWRRDEDAEVSLWRSDVTKRTVIYYLRTERVFAFQTRKLSQVKLDVTVDLLEGPLPAKYTEYVPDPSGTVYWPEPSASVSVSIVEQGGRLEKDAKAQYTVLQQKTGEKQAQYGVRTTQRTDKTAQYVVQI